MTLFQTLFEWTQRTFGPLGSWGLFILAFMESSFFPIPPDLLLIILTLERPDLWLWLVGVCTLGSVLGGMFGYGIGKVGEEVLLRKFVKEKSIERVHKLFEKYEAWAIFIAGFTPIPYKVFTIAAGVFFVNFKRFIIASVFGRGLRFLIVGALVAYFGQEIVAFIDRYFNILTFVVVAAILLVLWLRRRKKQ
ncbi:MAG: YqaA family protein [Nanoarchaeota archaeon]